MASQNFVTRPGSQFVQSGTGAVERTVTGKLQDVVNVKDFGAVGDGVADDTESVLLAVAYAQANSKPKVRFPKGTYIVQKAIQLTGITVIGDGLSSTNIRRTSLVPDVISGNNVYAVFYLTGGWNHVWDLSITGVSSTITGIMFGYSIPAKGSIRNVAINNCLRGIREVAGVFLTSIDNVQAVNCEVGFDFYSDEVCTSLALRNCYAANCGRAYGFRRVTYSNIVSCAADNCNWGTLPDNPYGDGFGSPDTSGGVYQFSECSSFTMANCGCEGSYGNGVVNTSSSQLTIDSPKFINCSSTYLPASISYAVGPIQGSTAANKVLINNPSITGWTNTAVPGGQTIATLVAFNYDQAVFGASNAVQFLVTCASGSVTSGLFAGPNAGRYCLLVDSLKNTAARAALSPSASAVSLTPYVNTRIPFDLEQYDTTGLLSGGTFTIPTGGQGLYQVNARLHYRSGTASTGDCTIRVYRNGAEYSSGMSTPPSGANGDVISQVSDTIFCNDGDTLEIYAFSVFGGNVINVTTWTRASFSKV